MTQFLKKPDLIIYLKASTDTLLSRIQNRDRNFERDISPEYLHSLNISYDKWINNCTDQKVITIESDGFNIFKDNEKLDAILNQIEAELTE
jgi:deoxyadenosine/deoxycytidine kinase